MLHINDVVGRVVEHTDSVDGLPLAEEAILDQLHGASRCQCEASVGCGERTTATGFQNTLRPATTVGAVTVEFAIVQQLTLPSR